MMSMIACNGWLDVLLYATTRADIVLTPYPPSDDIGLETFAFMGKGHTFGSALPGSWQGPEAPVGWVAVSGVRAETAWRAYMDWIRSRLRETSQLVWMMGKMRHRSAEHSTAETENSWDRTSRKSSQTRR
ncbi:hypothetical protein VC83_02617 [Pseudogymnoascus destructans]|nr:uncharacterized protein VC83_02617 [Pseudogymnoascus destructans]OAF61008.1 hypothetical protein VC83_02617 [Pseudogymnoascus destructans]